MIMPRFINIEAPMMAHAVLRHILETGNVLGRDPSGRVVITLAVEEWLLAFGAGDEDLEDESIKGGGRASRKMGKSLMSMAGEKNCQDGQKDDKNRKPDHEVIHIFLDQLPIPTACKKYSSYC